jgi:nucleotide-binding universal stress UspA family protein
MYRTIVVGTDCSTTADRAVLKAAELAKLSGAKLHIVSAYRDPTTGLAAVAGATSMVATEWPEAAIRDQHARIEATAHELRARGVEVDTRVEQGPAADALVAVADAVGADLLVVGDRGLKGVRGLLGSVPNRVTHRACLDVLVVHTA